MPIILPKRVFRIAAAVAFLMLAGAGYLLLGGRSHAKAETTIASSCGDKTAELEAKWKAQGHTSTLDAVLYCQITPEQKLKYAQGLKTELQALSEEQQLTALKSLPEGEGVNAELFFGATTLFSSPSHGLVSHQESMDVVNDGKTLSVAHDDIKVSIRSTPAVDSMGGSVNAVTAYGFTYKGNEVGEVSLPAWAEGSYSASYSNDQAEEFAKEIGIYKLEDGYLVSVPSQRAEGNFIYTFVRHVLITSAGFKEIKLTPEQDFQDYASNAAAALASDGLRTFYVYNGPVLSRLVRIQTISSPENNNECQAKIQSFEFNGKGFADPTLKSVKVACAQEFNYPGIYDAANPSTNAALQLLQDDKFAWLHNYILKALGTEIDRVYGVVAIARLKDLQTFKDGKELEDKAQRFLNFMKVAGVNPKSEIKARVESVAAQAVALSALPDSPQSLGYKQERFYVIQVISDSPGEFLANIVSVYQYPPKKVVIISNVLDQINHAGYWTLWAKQTNETKIRDGDGFVTSYPLYAIAEPAIEKSAEQHDQITREVFKLTNQALGIMAQRIAAAEAAPQPQASAQ